MSTLEKITGNTYPVKESLKSLGCRWDAADKCWTASTPEMAEQARAIVAGAGTSSRPTCTSGYRPTRCRDCGAAPSRYRPIYRNGQCRDCYISDKEEADMGY
jgi:hypothetical protein